MAPPIVRYQDGGAARWGKLIGSAPTVAAAQFSVAPIATSATTTADLIAAHDARDLVIDEDQVARLSAAQLLSPVTSDASLLCQGLNYRGHAAEAQHHVRKQNLFFAKASSSLTGPYSDIERPPEVQLLDYEVEVGVVLRTDLGRDAHVSPDALGEIVAGVVLCNDVSARDVMFGASFLQWFQGKSYRTFCPTGPVLYLLDPAEVASTLENLRIELWVNGELRQSASSSQLIFKPAETFEQLARIMDLKRGDLLLTGTPEGVTAPATPKLVEILKTHLLADETRRDQLRVEMAAFRPFLQPGDVVTARLSDLATNANLGGQESRIRAAT
jgi:2-keto-4-pentenoate hydratase/2-oxohepta-3-ene-1,7-dioic acid hydratase in catechol pathway